MIWSWKVMEFYCALEAGTMITDFGEQKMKVSSMFYALKSINFRE